VLLPAIDDVPVTVADPGSFSGTVLVIDDEETVRTVARRALETMGFSVLTAADGQAGIDAFHAHGKEIVLILVDLTLPGTVGYDVFRALTKDNPVAVLLMSGYNEQEVIAHHVREGIGGFLQKPFSIIGLRNAIADVMRRTR
jgi:CheY-like chemotaxis protein